jgi:hypothetical protein
MSGAITAAVVATAAVAVNIKATQKAARQQRIAQAEQEKQFKAEQRRADVQNVRSIREQVRATRIAQGQMLNVGAQTGGMGGSGLAGGMSSLASQQAGNIGYMQAIAAQNTKIGEAGLAGARAQSNAAIWGSIGQLASTVGSAAISVGSLRATPTKTPAPTV